MDLLLYRYPTLVDKAFELLVRNFSSQKLILEAMQQVQLLEDPKSIETLARVNKAKDDLARALENKN
jgi:hypothetical protein